MRINHNLSALNAWKNLTVNDGGQTKTLERLSSGLRIGRAADDAAGLSISEKMRGQISGLNQATRNAQDGISLLQTAEGALGETHSILQRMRELAVQAASDTVTNDDRAEIQKEVDALALELGRISTDTEFNTQKLIDGTFSNKVVHIGANADQSLRVSIEAMSGNSLGVAFGSVLNNVQLVSGGDNAYAMVTSAELEHDSTENNLATVVQATDTISFTYNGTTYTDVQIGGTGATTVDGLVTALQGMFDTRVGAGAFTVTANNPGGANNATIAIRNNTAGGTFTVTGATGGLAPFTGAGGATSLTAASLTVNGTYTGVYDLTSISFTSAAASATVSLAYADGSTASQSMNSGTTTWTVSGLTFTMTNAARFAAGTTSGTQTAYASGSGINVSSQSAANSAITTINNAINTVSSERSKLGAIQNRLEHTIANLATSSENLTAAESRIRDVDIAVEMMSFTKYQILAQASTAMLAQANAKPQAVLQLLR
jgi:flagellin